MNERERFERVSAIFLQAQHRVQGVHRLCGIADDDQHLVVIGHARTSFSMKCGSGKGKSENLPRVSAPP